MLRKLFAATLLLLAVLPSCVSDKEPTRKVVGPTTDIDTKPWNTPIAGQGGGVLSAMPNNPRR